MNTARTISNSSILPWDAYKSNSQRLQDMQLTTAEIKILRMVDRGCLPKLTPRMLSILTGKDPGFSKS
ncbi:hypothetical protein HN843_03855 [bacterium]|jgi:hypothetical protein|nr:hypothetical protein [bacterium]